MRSRHWGSPHTDPSKKPPWNLTPATGATTLGSTQPAQPRHRQVPEAFSFIGLPPPGRGGAPLLYTPVVTTRWYVIPEGAETVERYAQSMAPYLEEELIALLTEVGFVNPACVASMTDASEASASDFFVLTAQRA